MRLLEAPGFIAGGRVLFATGRTWSPCRSARSAPIRGRKICLVFQDPMTALNPVYRVGDQIVEAMQAHAPIGRAAALERASPICSASSAFRRRSGACTSIRTSSAAACASA